MKKIPTLFVRDMSNRGQITREHHAEVYWAVAGEGVATRKYDGTAALVSDGRLFKRHSVKPGKDTPPDFWLAEFDPATGIGVGWVPVTVDLKENKRFLECLDDQPLSSLRDGTYELVGPKVNGNPEDIGAHELVFHGDAEQYTDVPTGFDELREWLTGRDIEGLVWHHPDGRMAKIKLKDYNLKRGV